MDRHTNVKCFPPHFFSQTPGVGGAVVLSLVYCVLLQLLVAPIVWLTLLAVNLALIACTLLSFQKVLREIVLSPCLTAL